MQGIKYLQRYTCQPRLGVVTYEVVTMPRLGAATKSDKVVTTLFVGQPRLGVVSKRDKLVRTLYVSQERLILLLL